ncbi:single-stranded DNA-binding protein [Methylocystis parvus]|uniref:single-stranded DNA-binding protein n=1 Tax=Methylocystis parvus TaxID=134 RepID=UPI003C728AB1
MAGSVNKVILVGRLGRDPDIRTMPSGGNVVTFSVATDETWRDKNSGERKQRTEWHNVVIFNEGLGKIAEQYLKKGSRVYVEGMLCTREYTDKDGNQRKVTEIVLKAYQGEICLLDNAQRAGPDPESYGQTSSRPKQYDDPRMAMGEKPQRLADQLDDDIPL